MIQNFVLCERGKAIHNNLDFHGLTTNIQIKCTILRNNIIGSDPTPRPIIRWKEKIKKVDSKNYFIKGGEDFFFFFNMKIQFGNEAKEKELVCS